MRLSRFADRPQASGSTDSGSGSSGFRFKFCAVGFKLWVNYVGFKLWVNYYDHYTACARF
jgi:hypothetical protein